MGTKAGKLFIFSAVIWLGLLFVFYKQIQMQDLVKVDYKNYVTKDYLRVVEFLDSPIIGTLNPKPTSFTTCSEVQIFLLKSTIKEIFNYRNKQKFAHTQCIRKLEKFSDSPQISKLLGCLKGESDFNSKSCKISLVYYRSFAVQEWLTRHPLLLKKSELLMMHKLIWETATMINISKEKLTEIASLADKITFTIPNLFGAYKAKLIALIKKDIHFGTKLIDDEIHTTRKKLMNLRPTSEDIEVLRVILSLHKKSFYPKKEIKEIIVDFLLTYQRNPISYVFRSYFEWVWEKDKSEAIKWLNTGINFVQVNEDVLSEHLRILENADISDENIYNFPLEFDFID